MTDQIKLDSYLRASPALAVKFASDEKAPGVVEGVASWFGGEADSYGDVIAPGAYARSLQAHKSDGTLPFMLWQHDATTPIGRWTEVREDPHGLFVRGLLNLETEPGRRAHAHLKAGDIRGLSIGYTLFRDGYRHNPDGTRTLTAIDLKEVSLVTMPAQRRAAVTAVKSEFSSRAELEQILRDHLPGRAVKKLLHGGWPALAGEGEDDLTTDLERLAKRIDAARLFLKGI